MERLVVAFPGCTIPDSWKTRFFEHRQTFQSRACEEALLALKDAGRFSSHEWQEIPRENLRLDKSLEQG